MPPLRRVLEAAERVERAGVAGGLGRRHVLEAGHVGAQRRRPVGGIHLVAAVVRPPPLTAPRRRRRWCGGGRRRIVVVAGGGEQAEGREHGSERAPRPHPSTTADIASATRPRASRWTAWASTNKHHVELLVSRVGCTANVRRTRCSGIGSRSPNLTGRAPHPGRSRDTGASLRLRRWTPTVGWPWSPAAPAASAGACAGLRRRGHEGRLADLDPDRSPRPSTSCAAAAPRPPARPATSPTRTGRGAGADHARCVRRRPRALQQRRHRHPHARPST